jgi:hypothetical protein
MRDLAEIKEDIELLRKAVKKWSLISVGLGEDLASRNCALCQEYNHLGCSKTFVPIISCPIASYTHCDSYSFMACGCTNTPWQDWSKHQLFMHNTHTRYSRTVKCSICRELANKELMFLQKVLEINLAEYKKLKGA